MKNWKRKLISVGIVMSMLVTPALASDLASSELGVGIKNLITDVSAFLVVLSPIAGGAAAVYFLIRRAVADEQDGKLWDKRIKMAIICGVAGMLVSGIITLISSYF